MPKLGVTSHSIYTKYGNLKKEWFGFCHMELFSIKSRGLEFPLLIIRLVKTKAACP